MTFRTDDDTRGRDVGSESTASPLAGRTTPPASPASNPATRYPLAVDGAEPSPLLPAEVTTLALPPGRRLATVATVNDVHFGEVECGLLGTPEELGPCSPCEPGAEPYPEVMNRGAIDAIERLEPDAVVVKGDLTDRGTEEEYDAFLRAYSRLGARMHHVRGNHDAMVTETIAATGPFAVDLPGVDARGARHRATRHRPRPGPGGPTRMARRPRRRGDPAGARVRSPSSVGSELARAQRHVLRHQSRRQRSAVRGRSTAARRSPATSPGTPIARVRATFRRRATSRSSRSRA